MQSKTPVRDARLSSIGLLILLIILGWSGLGAAQVAQDSPMLPPESEPPDCGGTITHYFGDDAFVLFPNGAAFSDLRLFCFLNVQTDPNPLNGDEHQTFDSTFEGTVDVGTGPQVVVLMGPVSVVIRGKAGNPTGAWQTEILAMDLSGDVSGIPIQIRESPDLPSLGQTSVTDGGSGLFFVDSFFDVFTELSVAGGPFERQTSGPARMNLMRRVRMSAILPSPDLPPEPDPLNCDRLQSQYKGDTLALFPNGIDFSDAIHRCFKNVQVTVDPASGDETETFDSTLEGLIDDGSGPQPVVLMGPVTTVVRGKGGATTGSWDTEILSMDLSGDVGGVSIDIRESPNKKSPGRKKVTDDGDSRFIIDSFFDVFTELSVDGGPFQPQTNGAGRMDLEPIRPSVALPEPNLPPEQDPVRCPSIVSRYEGLHGHMVFPGFHFSRIQHKCFSEAETREDAVSGDEIAKFSSVFSGIMDDGAGPQFVELSGPVETVVRAKGGAATGSWDTEILSMDLSGDVGGVSIELRESPSKKSPGDSKVKDNGDGTFQIDSFFDVFTEISVDGGPFQPQTNEAVRIDLTRARPSAVLPQPDLPPEPNPPDCDEVSSGYLSMDSDLFMFPSGLDLNEPILKCFQNVAISAGPGAADETQRFDALFEAMVDLGTGPMPVVMSGPVRTVALAKGSQSTGTFDTEILSMSLSGNAGGDFIEIRESPARASEGKKKVDDLGGGQFEIDSFFDVFTEISINSGPFQPQTNEAVRMELTWLPEPAQGLGLLIAIPLLTWMAKRRRTV